MKDKGRAENGTKPAVNIKIFLPPIKQKCRHRTL